MAHYIEKGVFLPFNEYFCYQKKKEADSSA